MSAIISEIAHWDLEKRIMAAGYVFWAAAYVASILQSSRDRLPSIPVAAIVLNVTWEGIFFSDCAPLHFRGLLDVAQAWVCPDDPLSIASKTLLGTWFCLDLVLLAQAAVWGSNLSTRAPSEPSPPTAQWWAFLSVCTLGAVTLQVAFMVYFHDKNGNLTAWVSNVIMSVLFIDLVRRRPRGVGLSHSAAWFKLLGSGLIAVSAILAMEGHLNWTFLTLFALVLLFDLVYIWMLGRARAAPVEPPA